MSITTRSRIAVCIATLLIVIGFSSSPFAKGGGPTSEIAKELTKEAIKMWAERCHFSWGKHFSSEEKGWRWTICHPWAPVTEWLWKTEAPPADH
jgi:hypothetical protein